MINVIYGESGTGLDSEDNQVWHQGSTSIPGVTESNDRFGGGL